MIWWEIMENKQDLYKEFREMLKIKRREFGKLMGYDDPYHTVWKKENGIYPISKSDEWKMNAIELLKKNDLLNEFKEAMK